MADLGGGHNSNAVKLILAETWHEQGQTAVDARIREFDLATIFGLTPGTTFKRPPCPPAEIYLSPELVILSPHNLILYCATQPEVVIMDK